MQQPCLPLGGTGSRHEPGVRWIPDRPVAGRTITPDVLLAPPGAYGGMHAEPTRTWRGPAHGPRVPRSPKPTSPVGDRPAGRHGDRL